MSEAVAAAGVFDGGRKLAAVSRRGEIGVGEALFVVGHKFWKVLAQEAEVGCAGAGLQEERVGGEEERAGLGGEPSHAVDLAGGVIDAGHHRRAEDAGSDSLLAQAADGGEAEVWAGSAGFELAGERGVWRGDGEVDAEGVVRGDSPEQVDVSLDKVRLRHNSELIALLACEDLEDAACDAGAALDGLIRVGRGADGKEHAWVDLAEFLLDEPGGVLLEEDDSLEGFGRGEVTGRALLFGREELVGVAGVAVFAAELAAAVRVDAVVEEELAFGIDSAEDAASLDGAELDKVARVGVGGLGCEAGHAGEGWLEDGEEGGCIRFFFAYHSENVRPVIIGCQELVSIFWAVQATEAPAEPPRLRS